MRRHFAGKNESKRPPERGEDQGPPQKSAKSAAQRAYQLALREFG
jgi:hypothetical protein